MTVWIATGLLSAVVLAALILPLFRRLPSRRGHEAGVYADQAAEIETDRALGLIDQGEAQTLDQEIRQRLDRAREDAREDAQGDEEDGSRDPGRGGRKRGPMAAAIGIAILLPVFSFAVYGLLGSPGLPGLPFAERGPAEDMETQRLRQTVASLARRMQQSPDRLEGWKLLGRSSMRLGDYPQAAHAFRQASGLAPGDAALAASLAEALYMANGQTFVPESRAALDAALKTDPRLAKALFYQGLAQLQAGKHVAAVQTWTDLVAISPAGAPYLPSLRRQIPAAAKAGGIDLGAVRPRLAPARDAGASAGPGPSRSDVEAASQMSEPERAKFIRSMVARLAARLEQQPEDAAGWRRLARAYKVLGETKKAAETERRAARIETGGAEGQPPRKPAQKSPQY
jgi:cytochrome c-type biogenesis protein CcmH